ncbi:hypothetical protein [Actinoplanes sp. CA-252034]|uniref:hypothetical protein n=1 Tax=Actinoplanes sp. CA-252034 TaxID=3239906 RepID=UPI003D975E11
MVQDLVGDDRSAATTRLETGGERQAVTADDAHAADEEARRAGVTGAELLLWLHRGLSVAAVMGLVVGTRGFWQANAMSRPWLALVLTGAYLAMLVAAVLALCASRHRTLARLDAGVLVTAIVIKLVAAWPGVSGAKALTVDEGLLMEAASRALAKGRNPYTSAWPGIDPALPTQLMDGRTVFDFGYPPLGWRSGRCSSGCSRR